MGPFVKLATRHQLAITVLAVFGVFLFRVTQLKNASAFEVFLLLNILVAILFRPQAILASTLLGLLAANTVVILEAGTLFSRRYWTNAIAYLVFSGLMAFFNYLGHRLSARVRKEQTLREEIVASSLDAIVSIDDAGRFVDFNNAAVSLFGYSRQEVLGKRMVDLIIPPALREQHERGFARHLATGESQLLNRLIEMSALRKDGTVFPTELTIVKVEMRREVFFIGHLRDITERTQHEKEREKLLMEAERANRVKDELLANVSHELRTPLNAILGWSVMLKRAQVPPERIGYTAEVMERNALALSRLVDDLIDASVAMAGLLHLNLTAVDVASALRAAADSIGPAARVRNVAVEFRTRSDLGTILADAARIHQVLLNLLSNAVKFTPAGGRVALDAVRENDAVTIRVSDNGIGIAPEFLPFVFDRFRQADTSTTRTHGGIGLGLAIVKQLVGMMKGEVSVKSEGVGKGASFAVRFPAHGLDRQPT